jgi:ATP adenylyltransferase/5',5'''-P-1,P-4-tetraphosphate phosphorylase II
VGKFSAAYKNAYKRALSLKLVGKADGKRVLDELNEATTFFNSGGSGSAQRHNSLEWMKQMHHFIFAKERQPA